MPRARAALLVLAAALAAAPTAQAAKGDVRIVTRADGPSGAVATGDAVLAASSSDGRFVAFQTLQRLHAADTDSTYSIYVRDTVGGTTELVSRADGADGVSLYDARRPSISADGRYVAFTHRASGTLYEVAHLRDLVAGTTTVVSKHVTTGEQLDGTFPRVSGNGRYVVFTSTYSFGVGEQGGSNGKGYRWDRTTGTLQWVTRTHSGGAVGLSSPVSVSHDGERLAWASTWGEIVAGVASGPSRAYVTDVGAGTVRLASPAHDGSAPNQDVTHPVISGDGATVAFTSGASNLVAGDGNGDLDAFARDLAAGTTELLSRATGQAGTQASYGEMPSVSHDGRYVAFRAGAGLQAGVTQPQAYVRDRRTHTTTLASRADGANGAVADNQALGSDIDNHPMVLSADGSRLLWFTRALNVHPDKTQGSQATIFQRELTAAPVCTDGTVPDVQYEEPVTFDLGCTDDDGDALTLEVVTPPDAAKGALGAIDQAAKRVSFSPATGAQGTTTFTFRASDGARWSAPATITLTILAPPVDGAVTVTRPTADQLLDHGRPSFEGTASGAAGAATTVQLKVLRFDGSTFVDHLDVPGVARVGTGWTYRPTEAETLPDGTYELQARQVDGGGIAHFSSRRRFRIDAPDPDPAPVADDKVTITTPGGGNPVLAEQHPLLGGAAGSAAGDESRVLVKLLVLQDGTFVPAQEFYLDRSGTGWAGRPPKPLGNGSYALEAFQNDAKGRVHFSSQVRFRVALPPPETKAGTPAVVPGPSGPSDAQLIDSTKGIIGDVPNTIDGSNVIANGGLNEGVDVPVAGVVAIQGNAVVSADGAGVIAPGAGNLIGHAGGNLIGHAGGNVIANGGLNRFDGPVAALRSAAAPKRRPKGRPVVLAQGSRTFPQPGKGVVKVKLTKAGRKVVTAYLRHAKALGRRGRKAKPLKINVAVLLSPLPGATGPTAVSTKVIKIVP